MDEILQRFNGDTTTKETLLEYLIIFFERKIVERALKKESVESLADAILELKEGFQQLEIEYGIKIKETDPINEAR